MINKYGDWVDVNICFPLSPTETMVCSIDILCFHSFLILKVLFKWYHLKSNYVEGSKAILDSLQSSDLVQEEDRYISEEVQAGI